MPSRRWREWFGPRGESERAVFRTVNQIIENRLETNGEITKSEILEEFRRQPHVVSAFRKRNLSPNEAGDGRDTSRNMVDWFDSRYTRWQEHERYFSKLIRSSRTGESVYSKRAQPHPNEN